MIGLSYYKYVTKLVKKIKLNTTRILRMLVVFNIIFFTRFVTLTCSEGASSQLFFSQEWTNSGTVSYAYFQATSLKLNKTVCSFLIGTI